jgi:putative peptidoglycan lipid II flippase
VGAPIAIAYSLVTIQGLTDQAVAGRLGTGRVAALAYADRLFLLPLGFVVAALGPMLLGSLTSTSHLGAAEVAASARTHLATLTRNIAPICVLFAGAVPLIVAHIYEYGAFRGQSTTSTVAALDGFAVGLAAAALFLLFFRAMQAVAQLRAVVVITAGSVAMNAVLSVVFAALLGIYGDTLATSLTALATIQLQIHVLGRELGSGWARQVGSSTAVPVALACLAAFAVTTATRAHALSSAGSMAAGAVVAAVLWLYLRLKRS